MGKGYGVWADLTDMGKGQIWVRTDKDKRDKGQIWVIGIRDRYG